MNLREVLHKTFTNTEIVSAITSTIFIILLGYNMRKKGIFDDKFSKVMTKVVLSVSLPALVFTSFMAPIDEKTLQRSINILIFGILLYVILIFFTPLLYLHYSKDKRSVLSVMTTFGSTAFFGIPIISAIYGSKGIIYASIFNIGYRIFLYSYAYIVMSELKMNKENIKKIFFNPVIIATFLGLILWIMQPSMPKLTRINPVTKQNVDIAFFRIDVTAPWLFKPLTYLSSLSSPLAWLAIGSTLNEISVKEIICSKTSWHYTIMKTAVVPLATLAILFILKITNIMQVDITALATIVIIMATPTSAVISSYAIGFDREAVMTSSASFLSTFGSIIMIPIWIIVINAIGTTKFF